MRSTLALFLLGMGLALVCGCAGPAGDDGPGGSVGPQGPTGPAGPLGAPPELGSIEPSFGSAWSRVTLRGKGFPADPADITVTLDGHEATVISVSADAVVLEPRLAVAAPWTVAVAVEVGNQVSNPLIFRLVPSGYAGRLEAPMPTAPTGVVQLGADLFIAGGGISSPDSGLYRVEPTGRTTRVHAGPRFPVASGSGPPILYDGPVALATDGTDVYFTTTFGAVRRYRVSDGAVLEVLAPAPGGGGTAFPARTGLAFDGAGTLYVVDRNLSGTGGVIRRSAGGTITALSDPAFSGGGGPGVFGIASDGTTLFLSNESDGNVIRVSDPAGAFVVADDFATGATSPRGIARRGTEIVVSDAEGSLLVADAVAGGALTPLVEPGGYAYVADGLAANAAGDLFLAQPRSSAVRRLASGETVARIEAAGVRLTFGNARIGATWYLSTFGLGLFSDTGPGFSASAPDGAILEISPDGSSRVLARGMFPIGLVASAPGELTIADCVEARIYTFALLDGSTSDLLDASDGLTCPTDLVLDAGGTLFYVNADLGGGAPSTIGALEPNGTHDPLFAFGFPPGTIHAALSGGRLLTNAIGPGMEYGVDLFAVDAESGGVATLLVPGATAGSVASVGGSPRGSAYVFRIGLGEVLELDPATGDLARFGSALLEDTLLGEGGMGAMAFSIGFQEDGTMFLADPGQGALVLVAP